MLTLDHSGRRAAVIAILRAHSDAEIDRILEYCTPSVAGDLRDYLTRYGRPEPFSVRIRNRFECTGGGLLV